MARTGPPDDFDDQVTRQRGSGDMGGQWPPGPPGPSSPPGPPEPAPWYRRPAPLIGWAAAVLILIGLIVYGVVELVSNGEGTSGTPSTSSATTTTTTVTTMTTTEPTTTAETTSSGTPAPAQTPTQQPTTEQPTRTHRLPPLPSTITIPHGPTITLPPNLPH